MDFAIGDVEVESIERGHAAEALHDALTQDRGSHAHRP